RRTGPSCRGWRPATAPGPTARRRRSARRAARRPRPPAGPRGAGSPPAVAPRGGRGGGATPPHGGVGGGQRGAAGAGGGVGGVGGASTGRGGRACVCGRPGAFDPAAARAAFRYRGDRLRKRVAAARPAAGGGTPRATFNDSTTGQFELDPFPLGRAPLADLDA